MASCCPLATAPSCVSGSAWRPREAAAATERLSRSKRRKLRDRRVAVRKALLNSESIKAQLRIEDEHRSFPTETDSDLKQHQAIIRRLHGMEDKLNSVLELLRGSISPWQIFPEATWTPWENAVLHPDADIFVPADAVDHVPTRAFETSNINTIRHEAATRIQQFFRSRFEGKVGSHLSGSSDYDHHCESCGKLFLRPPEDYNGDRCDLCASPHHTECLHNIIDLHGEWFLCSDCLRDRTQASNCLRGDFRQTPKMFWQRLYSAFPSRNRNDASRSLEECTCHDGATDKTAEQVDDEMQKHDEELIVATGALQSRLDFMIQFLEGGHVKSSNPSENQRKFILDKVRETLTWRSQGQSSQAVQNKIQEIDDLMG
jgi:hypothetical protein